MRRMRQNRLKAAQRLPPVLEPVPARLIADLAQELNTPLATISAHAEEALELLGHLPEGTLPEEKRSELQDRLRIIQRQVRRSSRLAAQLLSLGTVDEAGNGASAIVAGDES